MTKLITTLAFLLPAVTGADLLVAATSDLAPLGPAIEKEFAKTNGQRVRFTFASSGSLARQIENGAPFDVFLSASDQYVRDLAAAGHVEGSSLIVYAQGRIALWSADGTVRTLANLTKGSVKHLAIANPDHAPYGLAARQALERQGLWKPLSSKLVYGENVRQALQYAESRNADAVITSWTLLKGRGILLPLELHDPILEAGALVKTTAETRTALRFLQFLTSPAGRKILEEGGLFPVSAAAATPGSRDPVPGARRPSAAPRSGRR